MNIVNGALQKVVHIRTTKKCTDTTKCMSTVIKQYDVLEIEIACMCTLW